jgi:hypothetical protein
MHWLTSARSVVVYFFELKRGEERLSMPVIGNPFVDKLIRQRSLVVKPLAAIAPRTAQPAQSQPTAARIAVRRQPLPSSRIAAKAAAYAAARF